MRKTVAWANHQWESQIDHLTVEELDLAFHLTFEVLGYDLISDALTATLPPDSFEIIDQRQLRDLIERER